MNEIARKPPVGHPIGGYVPMVDGPEKVSGRAKYTADFIDAADAGRAHLPQPLRARGNPRRRRIGGGQAAGRDRHRHRRRLRQDLRRPPHRAQRASPGARQGALQGRAGGGRCGHRRGDGGSRRAPDQDERARAAGLFHRAGGAGARCRAPACQEARQPRARRAVRAGQRRRRLRRKPPWCARRPTTAPRSARTRWRCTPRSPTTTPCATGSPCTPPPRSPTTCT